MAARNSPASITASLVIDLGGTKAIIGVLDASGAVIAKTKIDIRGCKGNCGEMLELICGEAAGVLSAAGMTARDIGFIGMGVPGTVDAATNRVIFAPNLAWHDVEVEQVLQRHFGQRAILVQDCRAAALAESLLGVARGERITACVTLGTGIGCGIVIDGRIYHGAFNAMGELGHIIVEENGEPCACGRWGCLEAYASGLAIVREARKVPSWGDRQRIDKAEIVFQRAAAGDADALRIIQGVVRHLGMGLVNLVDIVGPGIVVLSGGMCSQEELLIRPVKEYVMRRAYPTILGAGALRLEKALLGEDAPMIGAGLLYKGLSRT
jgi:glucokinase